MGISSKSRKWVAVYGEAAIEKIVASSETPTYMTISSERRLTRPFMTMPAVAFPRPPGRLSATKPRIRPMIASGTTHADASTVTSPATLIMPRTIEAVASPFLAGGTNPGTGARAGACAYTGGSGSGWRCGHVGGAYVADGGFGGGGVGGAGVGGFSASAVSHEELDRGRGSFPPAFSQAEFACGRGCRSEPVRLPTLHTPWISSLAQVTRA